MSSSASSLLMSQLPSPALNDSVSHFQYHHLENPGHPRCAATTSQHLPCISPVAATMMTNTCLPPNNLQALPSQTIACTQLCRPPRVAYLTTLYYTTLYFTIIYYMLCYRKLVCESEVYLLPANCTRIPNVHIKRDTTLTGRTTIRFW